MPRETLKVLKDNGLRLLLVGYEMRQPADPAQHQEGHAHRGRASASPRIATSSASPSTAPSSWACRARRRRRSRRRSASPREINPHTIQVSLAAPYPGTFLYKQAVENGWLDVGQCRAGRRARRADRAAALPASHATPRSSTRSRQFYRRFYFRAPKIASIVGEMVRSPRDDEAPAARGRRVLPLPARAARGRGLKRLVVTADDFGARARGQRGGRARRIATASSPPRA